MNKRLLILATVLLSTLIIVLSVPAYAGPPENANGLWQYTPTILAVRERGCNTFLTTSEEGIWTGTFTGNSTEDGKVVIHCSGMWSFDAIVSFHDVTVAGKSGTLEMTVVGGRPDASSNWTGRWVILSGTGDLASLRGQGTWWGPGAHGPGTWGDIYYSGDYHFEPQ